MTVDEQNEQKGIVVVFAAILLVISFLISGLQLNHVVFVCSFVCVCLCIWLVDGLLGWLVGWLVVVVVLVAAVVLW